MRSLKQKIQIAAAITILSMGIFGAIAAQTGIEGLQENIDERQGQLEQIRSEIAELQTEIGRKQREVASLKNEVALFDLNIRQIEAQIAGHELEIELLSGEIAETEQAIEEKILAIEREKKFLGETLRLMNEYDGITPLEITLGNDTFSEFLDQVQYASNLQEKTQEVLTAVKILKQELEDKKQELLNELAKEEEVKTQLELANSSLLEQRGFKQGLLTATRGQERIYQSLLSDAAKKQEQVEREIYELEVAIRLQLGDKTLPPVVGLLRWPMSGILTQGYGNTGFTALGYTFHNGLDIAAPGGTTVYAAADGLVFATGTGAAAYGNWVVIKHTLSHEGEVFNIYTLYAHLRQISMVPGQVVRGGDIVGFEGNSGNTTRLLYGPERGFHLHFTVFDEEGFSIKEGAYQHIYGPYQIPFGFTYNPLDFLN